MITNGKYNEVLENGLTLDHYYLLCNMRSGKALANNKRIQGFINLLTKKDYIKDDVLTEKALSLLENCDIPTDKECTATATEVMKINMEEWVLRLHDKCANKIQQLTGKKQVRGKLNGRTYAFLPNVIDLAKNVMKVITIYKVKDLDRMEQTIIKHIEACHAANHWFPSVYYYLFKEGKSMLVTDMEDMEDMNEEEREQFLIIRSKDLF